VHKDEGMQRMTPITSIKVCEHGKIEVFDRARGKKKDWRADRNIRREMK